MITIINPRLTLNNVTGWHKDINGQWKSRRNSLSDIDSFKSLRIYFTSYNNIDYIIFIKIYERGHYIYQNIRAGYSVHDIADCYLIKKDDFIINYSENEVHINRITVLDKKVMLATSNNMSNLERELNNFVIEASRKTEPHIYPFEVPTLYVTRSNTIRFILNIEYKFNAYRGILPDSFYYELSKRNFDSFFKIH